MTESVNYLTDDTITPATQKFVCISFLLNTNISETSKENVEKPDDSSKENVEKPDEKAYNKNLVGIKIRGVFEEYEMACEHAKKLQAIDPHFNIYVGEVGKWLPFNPDVNTIKTNEYQNDDLNNMMKSYYENQENANLLHEKRKNEMLLETIKDTISTRTSNLDELRKELKTTNNISNVTTQITCAEDQIAKLNKDEKDLEEKINKLTEQIKRNQ